MGIAPTFVLFIVVVIMAVAFVNWAIATAQEDKDGQL